MTVGIFCGGIGGGVELLLGWICVIVDKLCGRGFGVIYGVEADLHTSL